MNKKIPYGLVVVFILSGIFVVGMAFAVNESQKEIDKTTYENGAICNAGAKSCLNNKTRSEDVSCTMEAMVCPDGSSVGRIGPNCEFAPCPNSEDKNLVGNDKDEYGCIASAGYQWCEEKQKCLRVWEEKCKSL